MFRFVRQLRRWWLVLGSEPLTPAPYDVVCSCGHVASGYRRPRHQVITCANCGERLFVLPLSRLAPVLTDAERALENRWYRRLQLRLSPPVLWRQPLAVGCLSAVIASCLLLFSLRETVSSRDAAAEGPEALKRHFAAGQRSLAQGKLHLAQKELSTASSLVSRYPDTLTPAERRQLTQSLRQAALLADLLTEPLEVILRYAADLTDLDEREWQAAFRTRYYGRSIVLQEEVRCDGAGRCYLQSQPISARGQPVRLDVGDVQMLRHLPLEKPERVLFGARLASIHRDRSGTWIVHFQPDSGVLFTDFGAASACYLIQPAELRKILERQVTWLADLP